MRLLHITELRFQEFFDSQIPPYAILSHRWENDEVSYQDFLAGRKKAGPGYAKILACRQYAVADSTEFSGSERKRWLDWVWIDTCCIDKSSSAELSEAINSMYRWYANSVACYAYLSDVPNSKKCGKVMKAFRESEWFSRGWTLQELLAPTTVVFLNRDWVSFGNRRTLASQISAASGISVASVLSFWRWKPNTISAMEKFAWCFSRRTSRLEDQAYCLMGLFGVNMPLLYGEGKSAFRRLQLEIMRSENDESIFLWDKPCQMQVPYTYHGLLASSAVEFSPLKDLKHKHSDFYVPHDMSRPPYTVTNQGLEVCVPKELAKQIEFLLPLNVQYYIDGTPRNVYAIRIRRSNSIYQKGSALWKRVISPYNEPIKGSLVEYESETQSSTPPCGLYIVPMERLWTREQLVMIETELIYISL